MQLALEAPGACRKVCKMSDVVILPGQLGLLWLDIMFPGKAEKTWGNQVMSPKKIVFSWIVSQLNSSSYDIWSSTHSSVRVRNQEQRSIRDIFFKGLVMDKKLGNT